MDIQKYIDEYINWLRKEISVTKIGEYYEINTPFLDTDNDYLQFYVKIDKDEIFFTDDGNTINKLEMTGFNFTQNRKKQLMGILEQYGVNLSQKELTLKAPAENFPQKKHAFVQCLIHVTDMYMTARSKTTSFFLDDIQSFFADNDIFCMENVQFTGKSGFSHNYDFAIQRSRVMPERLCLAINNPTKTSASNALFAWSDTRPSRKQGSQLIVFLNDTTNTISSGVEEGFSNYDVNSIRWSERENKENIDLLAS
ncbi:DUF1829 domain-containing protein [Blautia liquoris]|uniref:DUF1829 domain-containing protein n=1 Tax=Blautia liquoris TaxID=2779518 RepID=A0A7M2RMH6_9FIRM|nr:DUF1829 domain-containing protein [Blautia liquoris]QOV20540.1 DUF1829 domain-containing protein [Blautia liquoris]